MTPKLKSIGGRFLKRFSWLSAIILIFAFIGYCYWSLSPVSTDKKTQIFVVQRGESVALIAKRLQAEKLIRNQYLFRGLVIYKNLNTSMQAGSFFLSPAQKPIEIAASLTHGTADIWLTFPEGWRREEYAERLSANLLSFNKTEFLKLTEMTEGYLFPDTYLLPKQATAGAVIKIIRTNFEKKIKVDYQTLILASLVEREAKNEVDRPVIAGILQKRFANNWPLQVDATVQYALGRENNWWPTVKKAGLQINSPYNTYKHKGLPPTPICNPGLATIKAVQNSTQTDYWFYLSDPAGVTHFARTAEEHAANIQKYLR